MKFYFCNSYQQSSVGFQYACLDTADMALYPIDPAKIIPLQIQSVLTNSGARCLIGSADGNAYFLLRGIEFTEETGRIWYINLAIVSDDVSALKNAIFKIMTDYKSFCNMLTHTFRVAQTDTLSYRIVPSALREWLACESPKLLENTFYQKNHFATNQFRAVLGAADSWQDPLFFLVPESTLGYFQKHNPAFSENTPVYQLPSSIFQMLLDKNCQLFLEQQGQSEDALSPDRIRAILGLAAVVGLSLAATVYVCDRLKNKENGRHRNG